MTGFVPKEKLTAYQRWEVAAFDEAEQAASRAARQKAEKKAQEKTAEAAPPAPVTLPTAADIERMYSEAEQQGYAAGHAEGLLAARAIVDRISSVLSTLEQALSHLDQQIADQLLATALEVARQMMGQSLRVKPELLLPIVREALSTLHTHGGHPALFVHPDDAALIRTHLGEQLVHNNWRIVEDASLTPGGCRVEHGASEVDATLQTRWRRVIESIGLSPEWLDDKP